MLSMRVIPVLLYSGGGLVKSVKFRNYRYVGDAINTVRIFNEKEVDELIFLDIHATLERRRPDFKLIANIAEECFMPVCYGGGVTDIDDIRLLFKLGIEKVSINSSAFDCPELVARAADRFGNQSIVVSLDVRKQKVGSEYEVIIHAGHKNTGQDIVETACRLVQQGAGEVLLNSIDRDGTMEGYDVNLVQRVARAVNVPVIACGGASGIDDIARVIQVGGASGAAAGSLFLFHGKHRAVLINYPTRAELQTALSSINMDHERSA